MDTDHTVRERGKAPAECGEEYRKRLQDLGLGVPGPVVGRGAMGVVVRLDGFPDVAGSVVVKLLRTDLVDDIGSVDRFRRELVVHRRLWKELQAPRLVPCLAVGETAGPDGLFGVFPFYPRGCLEVAAGELELDVVLRCVADAAEGLGALHGHGYIHRDVCPKNIFVAEEGGALRGRLGDLGVAVPLQGNTLVGRAAIERELGFAVGHLGYIDPWFGGLAQADLYGLGATLYFALTGTDPPRSAAQAELRLPPLEKCRPGLDADAHAHAQSILTGLMAQDQAKRFSSASDAASAIQELAAICGPTRPRGLPRKTTLLGAAAVVVLAVVTIFVLGPISSRRSAARRPGVEATAPDRPTGGALPREATAPVVDGNADAAHVSGDAGGGTADDSLRPPTGGGKGLPDGAVAEAATMVQQAKSLIAERKLAAAVPLLRHALAAVPTDPEASSLLALILSKKPGGSKDAVAILRRCLDANPQLGATRLQLARVLAAQGDLEEALAVLDGAPDGASSRDEIEHFRVTLDELRRRDDMKEVRP